MSEKWIAVKDDLPPKSVMVDTKIDDEDGLRNEQQLCFHSNLWWTGDDGNAMYVYYCPTHWRQP
jgi:hypothetical protein